MKNWLNDTSRDLNKKIFNKRIRSPGVVQRHKWHLEFLEKGLDKRMSFQSYLKTKTKEWFKQKNAKKTN